MTTGRARAVRFDFGNNKKNKRGGKPNSEKRSNPLLKRTVLQARLSVGTGPVDGEGRGHFRTHEKGVNRSERYQYHMEKGKGQGEKKVKKNPLTFLNLLININQKEPNIKKVRAEPPPAWDRPSFQFMKHLQRDPTYRSARRKTTSFLKKGVLGRSSASAFNSVKTDSRRRRKGVKKVPGGGEGKSRPHSTRACPLGGEFT